MLRPLCDKKSLVVLGLNSGTSADGLDLAVVRVTNRTDRIKVEFLEGKTFDYPAGIRQEILSAADLPQLTVTELIHLNSLLGQLYGDISRQYLRHLKLKRLSIDVIASHGQTIRHLPQRARMAGYEVYGTLQIGSLAQIAASTNRVTVGDFRQGDIAIGGEGAPITVAAMREMFGSEKQSRLVVNVGGMSNYFYFPAERTHRQVRAADCGPGNVLSDLLCSRLYHTPYDRRGVHASKGTVSRRLLTTLLASPYFSGKLRSTGREEFGEQMAGRMVKMGKAMGLKSDDLLATAMELTSHAIATALLPYIEKPARRRGGQWQVDALYLTGGGSHNRFLRHRLSELLGGLPVTSVRDLGMDPDLVEATAFAVMGAAAIWSRPFQTRFDGARQENRPVLGSICQPPKRIPRQG